MENLKIEEAGMEPAEALQKSGADYQVRLAPLFAQLQPGEFNGIKAVPTHKLSYAVSPDGTERRFGIVGSGYVPVDNLACLQAFDALRTDYGYTLRFLGHVSRGIVAIYRQSEVEIVPGDPVGRDIVISTDHGGRGPVRAAVTTVRHLCTNVLYSIGRNAMVDLRMRHTTNVKAKIVASAAQISTLVTGHTEMIEQFKLLASRPFRQESIELYLDKVVGAVDSRNPMGAGRQKKRRQDALQFILEGAGNARGGTNGTWWGAFNGATEWIESTTTQESSFIGAGADKKREALSAALEFATAA